MTRNEREEYSEWNVKEYEDYVSRPPDGRGHDRIWDVAKHNPYAAYMFARRMESGEIQGNACQYLMCSAEHGCSRAFWRIVTDHPGEVGIRRLCVAFDRCIGFRDGDGTRRREVVRTAEAMAGDHPVLRTALAYHSLCRRNLEAFDGYSAEACRLGDVHSMYMRAYRLLDAAARAGAEKGRAAADEAVGLLEGSSTEVWESARLLGEELWVGRWVPCDRDRATVLLEDAARRSGNGHRDIWARYLREMPGEDEREPWDHIPTGIERMGFRECPRLTDTVEWNVLMRLTRTNRDGFTACRDDRGQNGGYENGVFRINPFFSEGLELPFLVFKPADIHVYDHDSPRLDAATGINGARMMLRACVESLGADRYGRRPPGGPEQGLPQEGFHRMARLRLPRVRPGLRGFLRGLRRRGVLRQGEEQQDRRVRPHRLHQCGGEGCLHRGRR